MASVLAVLWPHTCVHVAAVCTKGLMLQFQGSPRSHCQCCQAHCKISCWVLSGPVFRCLMTCSCTALVQMVGCCVGKDATHSAISSWIWNKWTPAAVAEGTQGILTADYVTVDWNKVNNLTTIGLSPWYTRPTAHRQVGAILFSSNC